MAQRSIFILEDADRKFSHINDVIKQVFGDNWHTTRAKTMVEAEELLFANKWDLFILDVSMDVASRRPAFGGPTQAVLGGLHIAKSIMLEGLEAPTIVVTAFDSFSDGRGGKQSGDLVDLAEVNRRAKQTLGELLIGTVRYGISGWEAEFTLMLEQCEQ